MSIINREIWIKTRKFVFKLFGTGNSSMMFLRTVGEDEKWTISIFIVQIFVKWTCNTFIFIGLWSVFFLLKIRIWLLRILKDRSKSSVCLKRFEIYFRPNQLTNGSLSTVFDSTYITFPVNISHVWTKSWG